MMKKRLVALLGGFLVLTVLMAGCGENISPDMEVDSDSITSEEGVSDEADLNNGETTTEDMAVNDGTLTVRFGDDGDAFQMTLENNETANAIAGYVDMSEWRLPIYNYDESDVMQYYDVPSRYDIPSQPESVTQARAGDVFYSDPNRIVLYYQDAEISGEYTKVGTFEATDEFISAVKENPVLEGWDNKIVLISQN